MTRWLIALAVIIVGLMLSQGVLPSPASAHDSWINHSGAKGIDGTHCCGVNDCFVVSKKDMQPTAAGWLIKPTGEIVPYAESQSSEDQDFWRCKRYDGTRRCFFAPPQGF